ncbi:unnamed protein product [Hymenolepis diminuta]|uniref:Protein kinase domain-containing protein n=2 Tax=Hymenolepis diminuta TaxID=6216 RepID=A0A0R3SS82_HYMDI|nr:unnamed protein product [Hymenolepis diminuta]
MSNSSSASSSSHNECLYSPFSTCNPSRVFVHEEYKILKKIGAGGYSNVYKARHRQTKEIVALKKLRGKVIKKLPPDVWKKEVVILASLNHPNIIKFFDTMLSKHAKTLCLVLEYAKYNLRNVTEVDALSYEQIGFVMRQLLQAVKYLHDNSVIHKDIKQENILFNEKGMLKLIDFGVSLKAATPVIEIAEEDLFGSLPYLSVELLLFFGTYTKAIDIWAVGVIFAELFIRKDLFLGNTNRKMLKNIFKICGTPTEEDLPGVSELPRMKVWNLPKGCRNRLRDYLGRDIPNKAFNLIKNFLICNLPDQLLSKCQPQRMFQLKMISLFNNNNTYRPNHYRILQYVTINSMGFLKYLLKSLLIGVKHTHSMNITRGDLKPDSAIVNDRGMVKVGDFGQATASNICGRREKFGASAYISIEILPDVEDTLKPSVHVQLGKEVLIHILKLVIHNLKLSGRV